MIFSSLLFIPQKTSLLSVFQIAETPVIITKGHYGYSYVVEISFTHESLMPWLEQLETPLPLLLLDADWIKRSPKEIRLIKEKKFPVGLIGKNGDNYENIQLLNEEIATFEQAFSNKPLWYTTRNYQFTDDMKKLLFDNKINIIAPSVIWTPNSANEKYTKGTIVFIPFHENTFVKMNDIQSFIKNYPFMSIEENIFGYSIKTKTFP